MVTGMKAFEIRTRRGLTLCAGCMPQLIAHVARFAAECISAKWSQSASLRLSVFDITSPYGLDNLESDAECVAGPGLAIEVLSANEVTSVMTGSGVSFFFPY
jgi:hypothetical protein